MTKNPFLNAIAAVAYIVVVASIMFYGEKLTDGPDSVIAPVAMLSLFTLSAAMMAYIFMYEPLQLYFSNNKKQALALFLQTIGIFAVITVAAITLLFTQ